jgi:hypothetical protein
MEVSTSKIYFVDLQFVDSLLEILGEKDYLQRVSINAQTTTKLIMFRIALNCTLYVQMLVLYMPCVYYRSNMRKLLPNTRIDLSY